MNSDSWEHTGYYVSKVQLDALSALIAGCPEPRNSRCHCQAHDLLGRRDAGGRWRRPASFDQQRTFPMRRS